MLKESIAFTSVNIIINVSGYFDHLLVGGIVPEAKLHRRPWVVSGAVSRFCFLPTIVLVIVTSRRQLSYSKKHWEGRKRQTALGKDQKRTYMKWCGLGLTPKFKPSTLSNPNQIFCGKTVLRLQALEGHFLLVGLRMTSVVLDKPLKTLWTGTDSLSEITTCFMMAMIALQFEQKWVWQTADKNLDQNQKRISSSRPFRGEFRGNWHVPPCHSNYVILTSPNSVGAIRQSL